MSNPISSESRELSIIPQATTSSFSSLSLLAGSLYETAVGVAKKHPLLTGLAFGALAITGFAAYKYSTSFDKSVERLVSNASTLSELKSKELIGTFFDENWQKLGLPDFCNNATNRRFLVNKFHRIIQKHPRQSIAFRKEIAKNVVRNFSQFITESLARVQGDLTNDAPFRHCFGIEEGSGIQRMEILGDETHNKGRNPLCIAIQLNNQSEIIYKPRSVLSEQLICGAGNSWFHDLGLTTYRIYNKEQQNYGYCECLVNRENENTFASLQDLQALYIEFGKIEKAARAIGLSDLHYENLIMSNRRPYLIDTEIVLLPTEQEPYETHLFGVERPGALSTDSDSKNHIWLTKEFIQTFNLNEYTIEEIEQDLMDTGMTGPVLARSGLQDFIQELADQTHHQVVNFDLANVELLRQHLALQRHRIVIVDTESLSRLITQAPEKARSNFKEKVQEGIEGWGFTVDSANWDIVLEKFNEDLRNNDVSIFYHDANQRAIYYGTHRIGYMPNM